MQTFGLGARGFLVAELQAALERTLGRKLIGGADGRYGNDTMRAVMELASAHPEESQKIMREQRALFGQAGPAVFAAVGLEWPERFARCLQLTAGFEGTGFDGSCGPRQTGDTAGVTYGIIGFTSYNGELQELLATAGKNNPGEYQDIAERTMGTSQFKQMMREAIVSDNQAFERWALYGEGSVRETVKRFLRELGQTNWMRQLQMQRAYTRYYQLAARQGDALFKTPVSDRAYALMFDIAVQNGGLKSLEISDLQGIFKRDPAMTETDRMHRINTRLIERLRNNKRPTKIIDDVRSRKNTIATGSGRVHGADWVVRSFAL